MRDTRLMPVSDFEGRGAHSWIEDKRQYTVCGTSICWQQAVDFGLPVRHEDTSVCGLKLLVHEALSYRCAAPRFVGSKLWISGCQPTKSFRHPA
jgi:hypothetical protein